MNKIHLVGDDMRGRSVELSDKAICGRMISWQALHFPTQHVDQWTGFERNSTMNIFKKFVQVARTEFLECWTQFAKIIPVGFVSS